MWSGRWLNINIFGQRRIRKKSDNDSLTEKEVAEIAQTFVTHRASLLILLWTLFPGNWFGNEVCRYKCGGNFVVVIKTCVECVLYFGPRIPLYLHSHSGSVTISKCHGAVVIPRQPSFCYRCSFINLLQYFTRFVWCRYEMLQSKYIEWIKQEAGQ
jgi:hypothetical protein